MTALLLGLGLGLAAGVSPGPMLFLTLTTALRDGARPALIVACAPLLSDLVVVAVTVGVLGQVPDRMLSGIGVVGGLVVCWMGWQSWREADQPLDQAATAEHGRRALRRAVLVNLVSPHPWLSWATFLGPLTVRTWHQDHLLAVVLVVGFYLTLVGAKAVIALTVGAGRGRLNSGAFRAVLRVTSVLLAVTGVVMFVEFGRALLG